jgi:hypothetical protein
MAYKNTLHDARFWRITDTLYETVAQNRRLCRQSTALLQLIDMKRRPSEIWPLYRDLPDEGS